MSYQAQVPAVAAEYFKRYEVGTNRELIVGTYQHPIITAVFFDDRGWRRSVIKKRVSGSWLRRLRSDGDTAVVLSAYGHDVDFTLAELLKAERQPLLGGALIGSRNWPAR